ncbi:hypothetical protein NLG97_g6605 [Lecanicillium saksenae]|uniref:Uncharacterized protein n=1 Tax=Lecanicillium saksenae TaxID=468837 RepID=A0ACC1QP56_9HYPO|nr:hypothetical protein NLG97_g6605 [Lecanicillium saksenae]
MSPCITNIALSGLGPRNAQYLMFLAAVLLANEDRLATLRDNNVELVLRVTVFERQGQEDAGCGNAFQVNCDAATNTGVTALPRIAGIDTIDPTFRSIIDLAGRAGVELQAGSADVLDELESCNPVASLLFRKALRCDGTVDTAAACMTRGQWGLIQRSSFFEALKYIKTNLPQLDITIHYQHEVVGVDFSVPTRPCVIVRGPKAAADARHEFDLVAFAHGTPLVSPVSSDAAPMTYSLTPNHSSLGSFLQNHGMLDGDGYVIPGKSILITGESLSAYDYATILMPFLRGFCLDESNPVGYDFSEASAAQYRCLITFISRSECGPAPPRIVSDLKWRGAAPILTTREMHALRLQRRYNWLDPANEFLEANVARSTNQVPSGVTCDQTSEEYMAKYYADSLDHLTGGGSSQETALLCAGYLAFMNGSGFETDPDTAEAALIRDAPFTRHGRAGWPFFSASGVEMSSDDMIDTPENSAFFRHWRRMHNFAAASPAVLQHSVALLFQRGIARHQVATFDMIGLSSARNQITLADRRFDVALAPKVISREADVLRSSSVGGVKQIIPGMPDYGKGMHLRSADGVPISAFDFGLGGWGLVTQNGQQELRTVGKVLNGTNSHGAAADWASSFALYSVLLSVALAVRPNVSPIHTVSQVYEQTLPDPDVFDAEVASFKPVWREVQEKLLFLRLCKDLAGCDAAKYSDYTEQIFTRATRDNFLYQLGHVDPERAAAHAADLDCLPQFEPPTIAQHDQRFRCFTKPQLDDMWDRMFRAIVTSNGGVNGGRAQGRIGASACHHSHEALTEYSHVCKVNEESKLLA